MSSRRVVIPLAKGDYLTEAGYNVRLATQTRHRALVRAVGAHGYRAIVLRLNAVSIRMRNIAPSTYARLRDDMAYLKEKYRS